MHTMQAGKAAIAAAVAVAVLGVAGCSSMYPSKSDNGAKAASAPATRAMGQAVSLSGANEVPPVPTAATGNGTISIAGDGAVSGSIKVTGIAATAAHIHQAAKGVNGPVIVPLTKSGDDTFNVPAGAKLTDAQLAAYRAGDLYVNVHSAAHPGGEIRAQLAGR